MYFSKIVNYKDMGPKRKGIQHRRLARRRPRIAVASQAVSTVARWGEGGLQERKKVSEWLRSFQDLDKLLIGTGQIFLAFGGKNSDIRIEKTRKENPRQLLTKKNTKFYKKGIKSSSITLLSKKQLLSILNKHWLFFYWVLKYNYVEGRRRREWMGICVKRTKSSITLLEHQLLISRIGISINVYQHMT